MSINLRKISSATQAFVEEWERLAPQLVSGYGCHMTCDEVDTLAELFRLFGRPSTADYLVEQHESVEDEPESCRHLA